MRPQSIIRFEQLYLGSTLITLVVQVLNFLALFGPVRTEEAGLITLLIVLALTYGLAFLFWYLIARRASNIAKWILVVISVLGAISTVPLLLAEAQADPAYALVMALVFVLQLVGIAYLFRRDAAEWLRSRGEVGVIDVTTFN